MTSFKIIPLASHEHRDVITSSEYCNGETFQTNCLPHEVVVMTSATYGRMRIGKCVQHDLGYLGCKRDVISTLDDKCSGRNRCEFPVTSNEVTEVADCLKELKLYLNASYSCLPSESGQTHNSVSSQFIPIIVV